MNLASYQSIGYTRVPNQEATLFILKSLSEEQQFRGLEFLKIEKLLHLFMYYGISNTNISYRASIKRFNGAMMWLFMHGSLILVGEDGISLNHESQPTRPSRTDIRIFKYALFLAAKEFSGTVESSYSEKLVHI